MVHVGSTDYVKTSLGETTVFVPLTILGEQGVVTPIRAVLRAATGVTASCDHPKTA